MHPDNLRTTINLVTIGCLAVALLLSQQAIQDRNEIIAEQDTTIQLYKERVGLYRQTTDLFKNTVKSRDSTIDQLFGIVHKYEKMTAGNIAYIKKLNRDQQATLTAAAGGR